MIDKVQGWLNEISEMLSVQLLWIVGLLIVAVLLSVVITTIAWRSVRSMKSRLKQALMLAQKLQPDNGLEQNLNDLLELVGEWIDAPTYVFYLYDEKKKVYLLKAVRHRAQDFGKVEPSYSGLVEYKKEQYLPPLSVTLEEASSRIMIEKAGEVKLLAIPIGERQGLIRIGPLRNEKLRKQDMRSLQDFNEMTKHALRQLISVENIRNKANVIVSTGDALQRINNIAKDSKVTIDFVLKLATRVMNANGAFFGTKQDDGYQLYAVSENEPVIFNGMESGKAASDLLEMQSEQAVIRLITNNDEAFYQVPPFIAAIGADAYAVMDVSERREEPRSRMLVLWFMTKPQPTEWQGIQDSLQILADNMREVLGYQLALKQFSGSYVHILKTLAQLQDNLIPHTVGYSELMSRYSAVIAKELGLEDEVIRDVALAAYLSNIGVMGITGDLVNKEGKFSEEEFEMMKLHSEVGASIVESTLGNERVASYILYHHERIDGNGYPSGLRGEEIPIGARIIGIVQTFLAVINGRKYRDPMPFDKALQTLLAAAGTQMDSEIVNTFLKWFKNKQAEPKLAGRSLGVCWEMCCTPSSICESCPAYQRIDKNCWEFETNNCTAHGKSCNTCFVRTETLTRKEPAIR